MHVVTISVLGCCHLSKLLEPEIRNGDQRSMAVRAARRVRALIIRR